MVYTDAVGYGGAEISLGTLLEGLADRFEVTVVGTCPDVVEQITAHRGGAESQVVPSARSKWDVSGASGHLRAVRRIRPDILHANLWHAWSCQYAIAAGNLTPGVRTVGVLHSLLPPRNRRQLMLNRPNLRHMDAFVVVSNGAKQMIEETVAPKPRRLRVIPNGVPDRDLPAPARELAGDSAIGAVGRLSPEKGYDVLLRALAELPGATLTLVGAGPEQPRLEQLAGELGLRGRIRATGWLTDYHPLLSTFDVFVQPSRTDAAPLSVIEAMLAARPVVATEVGGLPELVIHGETGLLVPPDQPRALAEAIAQLLGDPDRRRRMGERGRAVARERFSVERMVDGYQLLYDELVA